MATRAGSMGVVAVVGGAVVAAAASGQSDRLFFEVSNDIGPSRPSAVVTLWAAFDPDDYAFAGVAAQVHAGGGTWSGPGLVPPMDGPGSNPGRAVDGGRVVEGIIAGQLHFPMGGVYALAGNPIALWSATLEVDDFSPRTIALWSDSAGFATYLERDGTRTRRPDLVTEARATIRVVPAPASGAVLVLGVLAAARRRR